MEKPEIVSFKDGDHFLKVHLRGRGVTPFKFRECVNCKMRYSCVFNTLLRFGAINLKYICMMHFEFIGNYDGLTIGAMNVPLMDDFTKHFSEYGCDVSPGMAIHAIMEMERAEDDRG